MPTLKPNSYKVHLQMPKSLTLTISPSRDFEDSSKSCCDNPAIYGHELNKQKLSMEKNAESSPKIAIVGVRGWTAADGPTFARASYIR